MGRAILELIAILLIIGFLRSVIGILKDFANRASAPTSTSRPGPRPPVAPSGGELKKDPVCGTFIAESTALRKTVGGQVYYFCSPECRDKFTG